MDTHIVTLEITKPYNEWVMHFDQSRQDPHMSVEHFVPVDL